MNFKNFVVYVLDTETTGLDASKHEIIELSILRVNDNKQITWAIKPSNYATIEESALAVNHHKLEDLKHLTDFGKQTYRDPKDVIVEIENWIMEDGVMPSDRILCGQNIQFDLNFLEEFWKNQDATDTFPFGKRPFLLDTRQIALFLDLCKDERQEYYNLNSLIKKFGVKNTKAHTAAADVAATAELITKQIEYARNGLK